MPINPPAPVPTVKQRAVTRAKAEAQRHTRQIEVALLGVALGVLIVLTGGAINLGIAAALTFAAGAAVEALAMRVK